MYAVLAPYRGRRVIQGGANVVAGPVSHYLGLLAMTLGRRAEAAELFSKAAALAGQIGACRLAPTRGLASPTRWPHAAALVISRPPRSNGGGPGRSPSGWA